MQLIAQKWKLMRTAGGTEIAERSRPIRRCVIWPTQLVTALCATGTPHQGPRSGMHPSIGETDRVDLDLDYLFAIVQVANGVLRRGDPKCKKVDINCADRNGDEMTPREIALQNIEVGDVFHALAASGGSLICLAISITDSTIRAKTVTTQLYYNFDRHSGIAIWKGEGVPEWNDEEVSCTIDSVARLPNDILEIVMGLDRKFSQPDRESGYYRLTTEEKRALILIGKFYPSNPI